MFQNIAKDFEYTESQENKDVKLDKKDNMKRVLYNVLTKENIVLYIICFLISTVNFRLDSNINLSVFGLAILAAAMSNGIPIGIIYIICGIGTYVGSGLEGLLSYIFSSLVLFASIYIIRPKVVNETNEKRRIGPHLFLSTLAISLIPLFFNTFLLYDFLISIMISIAIYIFYKIFSNSITVIKDYMNKKAYSIEEVIGASLLVAIAVLALEPIQIFGFSLKNICSILLVLILGWKHGILVGGGAGITIGVVLGIISDGEPIMVASYAIAGLVAGLFNKFGRPRGNCRIYFRKCFTNICCKWKCSTNNII